MTIILLTFLISCSSNDNWTEFRANGLPDHGDQYEDIIFINDSTGYIGGRGQFAVEKGKSNSVPNEKAVLYKTTDRGKSWKKIQLDYVGSVSKIFCFKDTLIILLQHILADTTYILKTINNGKSWDQLLVIPSNIYIRDILFNNPEKGLVVTDNRKSQYLILYESHKWDTLFQLSNKNFRHILLGDRIISLIEPDGNATGVVQTLFNNKEKVVLNFDKIYFINSFIKDGDNILFAAHDTVSGSILKLKNNKIEKILLGSFSNYIPDKVFSYGRTLIIIAHRHEDVAFLGVIHSLLISYDSGKTWTLEEIPSSMSPEPAFMYKDKYFISSSLPPGYLQIRQ
ncbi:MAG: hypothetical protein JNK73_05050 [Bacteroidia bacterium]|nr:hypothetical protein [Bacteroidia bacterium]